MTNYTRRTLIGVGAIVAVFVAVFLAFTLLAKDLDGQRELITQHHVGDYVVCYRTISPGTGVALSCVKR